MGQWRKHDSGRRTGRVGLTEIGPAPNDGAPLLAIQGRRQNRDHVTRGSFGGMKPEVFRGAKGNNIVIFLLCSANVEHNRNWISFNRNKFSFHFRRRFWLLIFCLFVWGCQVYAKRS